MENEIQSARNLLVALRKVSKTTKPPAVVWREGERILFRPTKGAPRRGTIKFDFERRRGYCLVQLQGDPYAVYISENQIEKEQHTMTTTTRKKTKKRRPVEPLPEVPAAAEEATKKTLSPSRAGRKPVERPTENPYRPGSNSWHYTEAMKKGGKRSVIVRNVLKKVNVHPWTDEEFADEHMEVDKRITMVAKELETKYGFRVERRGRGSESFIKVTAPGGSTEVSESPVRTAARANTAKKATKRTATKSVAKPTKRVAKRTRAA